MLNIALPPTSTSLILTATYTQLCVTKYIISKIRWLLYKYIQKCISIKYCISLYILILYKYIQTYPVYLTLSSVTVSLQAANIWVSTQAANKRMLRFCPTMTCRWWCREPRGTCWNTRVTWSGAGLVTWQAAITSRKAGCLRRLRMANSSKRDRTASWSGLPPVAMAAKYN